MSEGTTGTTGNGAASKGTAPAAGVSTPTVTPKSGEGAVVPNGTKGATSATKAPPLAEPTQTEPPKFQPIKRTLKFGNGETREVVIDSEEALDRYLTQANSFDRTHKERLKLQKQNADILKALRENPDEALKLAGHDPEAFKLKWAEEQVRRLEMTEEQRIADDIRQENARLKRQAEAYQKQQAELQRRQQEERAWNELAPKYKAAMDAEGIEPSDYFIEDLARVSEELAELDLTPEQLVKETKARDAERFSKRMEAFSPEAHIKMAAARLDAMGPDELRAVFPKELLRKLGALHAQDVKRQRGLVQNQPKPAPPRATVKEYRSPGDYWDKLRGR